MSASTSSTLGSYTSADTKANPWRGYEKTVSFCSSIDVSFTSHR